jgi:hypothetical protein
MPQFSKTFVLSLLLGILLSNAAYGAHAGSHVSDDAVDCALCAAHTDSSDVDVSHYADAPKGHAEGSVGKAESEPPVAMSKRSAFSARGPPKSTM